VTGRSELAGSPSRDRREMTGLNARQRIALQNRGWLSTIRFPASRRGSSVQPPRSNVSFGVGLKGRSSSWDVDI